MVGGEQDLRWRVGVPIARWEEGKFEQGARIAGLFQHIEELQGLGFGSNLEGLSRCCLVEGRQECEERHCPDR